MSSDLSNLSFRQAIKHSLRPANLLRSVFASAIIWLLVASIMPSLSGLIYHGRLESSFANGLSIAFVSLLILMLVSSLLSSDRATLAVPQSPTVLVQAAIVANVIAVAPADMSADELSGLVFVILALSTVVAGCFLLILGVLRAGGLIRHVPYPIAGGIVAGVGWLMVNAGFFIIVGVRVSAANLPHLLEGDVIAQWLPGVALALGIIALQARVKNAFILPGAIVLAFLLFYAWSYLFVDDVNVLRDARWFLPEVPDRVRWNLPDFGALAKINFDMLTAIAGGLMTMIVIWTLNMYFKASAQELVVDREVDINRECTVNGVSNIVASLCGGGMPGYHTPGFSALVESLGVNGRLVGVILPIMLVPTLLFGNDIFALIPRFVPGGLLMYFGLLFMKEWLLDSWSKLPRKDYLTVLVITLASAVFGLLPGIALGLVLAISFFVVEYSRMDVIKQEFSGGVHRSNLDRPFSQNQYLQKEGDKILILRLQGFIFFGSAYRFYENTKMRVSESKSDQLKYLILDFKAVSGFDYSTIHDFKKLQRLSARHGIGLCLSNVLPHLQPVLQDAGIVERRSGGSSLFNDLDHALEWCENTLLKDAELLTTARVTVEEQLAEHTEIQSRDVSALNTYLERIETDLGDTIFNQDDDSDALYFIESGRVDVLLRLQDDQVLRLRSMTAGTVVGEVGFYLKNARTASVVVTEVGVLQRLSQEALREMGEEAPRAASAIHVFILRVLSDRLSVSNRVIQELMD